MTVDPGASDPGRPPAASPRGEEPDRLRSGRVAELALVACGLGLVVYLLGFVDDVASGTLVGPLLLGGGLLAGAAVLPTAGPRVLVPAAVATGTGALLLLQAVVGGGDSAVAIAALVLAVLQAAAAGGAALLQAGAVRLPRRTPRRPAPPPPPPGYPAPAYAPPGYPAFPGQQYPGQPYPGSYPGHPGAAADPYAGEHAYAQYARYGAPYGVPGYPPPPPYPPPSPAFADRRPEPGPHPVDAATVVGPPAGRADPPTRTVPAVDRPAESRDEGPAVAGEPAALPRTGSSSRADPEGGPVAPAGGAEGDDRPRLVRRPPDER